MFGVMLTLMLLDGLLLGAVILMQAGQGGGLASLGGGTASQVLGGRQATTILTRMTWWCGGIFMGLALVLSLTSSGGAGTSAVQKQLQQQARQGTQQELPTAPLPGASTTPPAAAPITPPPTPAGTKKP